MKITIPAQTVNVDPAQWVLAYGVDRKDVRADVKAYFDGWLQGHIDALDMQPKQGAQS